MSTLRRNLLRAALCALLLHSTVGAAPLLDRPADPVVLLGSVVPTLGGAAPADVVAFRWGGGWVQVPVQIDERALVDLNDPYGPCPGNPACPLLPSPGTLALQYTDAGTFTGADPNPALDADDEIVVMAKDTGSRAPASSEPPGVVPGSGVEIQVTDPLDGGEGWLYLFRQTGSLDPSAGQTYVAYDFHLLSGPYLSTYQRHPGPNPEHSTITSPFYSRHFSDRWLDDGLAVTAGAATGVDVLDRHKLLVSTFGCLRSEDTFDAGEGCFVVNKSGPVRAIRSYMGANSGPHTQRQHLFYERREDLQTVVRVHSLPGPILFLDYSPAAAGMVYRNDVNPAGVTIDGVPDSVTPGPFTWETVDGVQGGLTMLALVDTDIPGLTYTSTYDDDASPGGQCTGDAFAYGASGLVLSSLPSTDVAAGGTNHLVLTRITYYEAPGTTDGPGRHLHQQNPLVVTVISATTTTTTTTIPTSSTTTTTLGPATDVPVRGLKLTVVAKTVPGGKAKATFIAKDASITKGAGTDPTQIEASLEVAYDGARGVFAMPQGARWLTNSGKLAKYVNKTSPASGAVKVSVLKPGSLVKVVSKSLGDAPLDVSSAPSGAVYVAVTVVNGGLPTRLCTQFSGCVHKVTGGGTGYTLTCKGDSVGDPACMAVATTTSTSIATTSSTSSSSTTTTTSTSTTTSSTTSTTLACLAVSGCFCDTGPTVIDTCTNLEWEKKNGADGTPGSGVTNPSNLHDVDNRYVWAGTCTGNPTVLCQPNAAAATTCAAQTAGALGCAQCGMADGTCSTAGGFATVWDWVNQLNTTSFAGHADWRLPTTGAGGAAELESILALALGACGGGSGACIDPLFGPTVANIYWSATTVAGFPQAAYAPSFLNGNALNSALKSNTPWVRAVR